MNNSEQLLSLLLFRSLKVFEQPVENGHANNDAACDGDGHFEGIDASVEGKAQLIGQHIAKRPEQTASWHQWDDAADEENGDRATLCHSKKMTHNGQN